MASRGRVDSWRTDRFRSSLEGVLALVVELTGISLGVVFDDPRAKLDLRGGGLPPLFGLWLGRQ